MWQYQKRLEYPVNIKNTDARAAKVIMAQLGGPDGELGAASRYLHQRYSMPYDKVKAMLTDIGTDGCNAPSGQALSAQSYRHIGKTVLLRTECSISPSPC